MSKFKKINFIVIGPGKSGTSWMYNILKNHPDVCISSSKETLYFENYYDKGENWYHHFFQPTKSGQVLGEISNTYIFDAKVPERIAKYDSQIKLITSLRNPIDRTFSHYLYMLRVGEEKGTFDEVLAKRPDLIHRGSYAKLLKEYDAFFDRSQILVLLFEELKNDTNAYARKLLDFLSLDHVLSDELLNEKVLVAGKARNPLLSSVVSKLAHFARESGYPDLVTKVKFNKNVTKFFYKDFKKGEKPKLTLAQRENLKQLFYEDVEKLSDRLQKDMIQYWNF